MKKVLLWNIGKSFGGAERTILTLLKSLSDRYEFFVCARSGTKFAEAVQPLISEHCLLQLPFSKRSMKKDRKKLIAFCGKNGIGLIHCHGIGALVLGTWRRKKLPPVLYTIHGDTDFDRMERPKIVRWVFRKFEIRGMKRAVCNLAVSNDIKEKAVARGIAENKVKVIYNGIELKDWDKREAAERHEKIRIMSMGRLEPVKGYAALIEAVRILKEKGTETELDLYGEGRERGRLEALIEQNGLSGEVSLKGFRDDADALIREYDFYIQPSLYETFGLSLLEAMKAGVPVICSAVGGMKEIVSDRENGILIYGNRPEDISEAIGRAVLCDRSELVENANARLPLFSLQKTVEETEAVYSEFEN